jgi:hypothetical protein
VTELEFTVNRTAAKALANGRRRPTDRARIIKVFTITVFYRF